MPRGWGRRRSIRLQGYDYSQEGAYFVTILTKDRQPFFEDPLLHRIAEETFLHLPDDYPGVEIDTWVIMPDHVHLLLSLSPRESREASPGRGGVRAQLNCALTARALTDSAPTDGSLTDSALPPPRPGKPFHVDRYRPALGQVIRTYKARVTRRIHQAGEDRSFWHRNYYERVIRNDREFDRVREYILLNPEGTTVDFLDFDNAGER